MENKYFNIANQKETILNDVDGYVDFLKVGAVITHENIKYTYIASGGMRDVFRSEDGLKVLKLPTKKNCMFDSALKHNILEFRCYDEAPDWCKNNIAKSELTKEGFIIQEFVDVKRGLNNYYRELGVKTDGSWVVFDCDIFLDAFNEPKKGFKYQEVFSGSNCFGLAYEYAEKLPELIREKQKIAREKYFPNLENQKFRSKESIVNGNRVWKTFLDDVEIPNDLAKECGFI